MFNNISDIIKRKPYFNNLLLRKNILEQIRYFVIKNNIDLKEIESIDIKNKKVFLKTKKLFIKNMLYYNKSEIEKKLLIKIILV